MQRTMRSICSRGAQDCMSMPLREFIDSYQSQVALLGIQMLWTSKVQDCLEKSQKEKVSELQKKQKDINGIMTELSQMCLEDMNKLRRMKIETIVTIHVHQRDTFERIQTAVKAH